jgi:hypothetical protein
VSYGFQKRIIFYVDGYKTPVHLVLIEKFISVLQKSIAYKMESQPMCPVCTLYLRPGMSLQDHLYTHPKDQVIEALVRLAATGPNTVLTTQPATINTNSQFTAITYRQFQVKNPINGTLILFRR